MRLVKLKVCHAYNLVISACIDSRLPIVSLKPNDGCVYKFLRAVVDPPESFITIFVIILIICHFNNSINAFYLHFRGANCKHLQCFDACGYLRLNAMLVYIIIMS